MAGIKLCVSLQSQTGNAALVKGLRRLPFTEESRVRIPYVVHEKPLQKRLLSFIPRAGQKAGQNEKPEIIFIALERMKQKNTKVILPYKPAELYLGSSEQFVFFSWWSLTEERYIREKVRPDVIIRDKDKRIAALEIIRDELNQLIADRNERMIYHEVVKAPAKPDKKYKSLQQWAQLFETDQDNSKDSIASMREFRRKLDEFQKEHPLYSGCTPNEVNDILLKEFIKYCKETKRATKTINKYLYAVQKLFEWMKSKGYSDKEYTTKHLRVDEIKNETERFPPLTHEQKELVFNYYRNWEHNRYYYLFILHVYYTCIRPVELHRLKIEQFDFKRKTIYIPWYKSKNGLSKYVQILEPMYTALMDFEVHKLPKNFYLFGAQCQPSKEQFTGRYTSDVWMRHRERIGLPETVQMYGLKHTFNVDYIENNKDQIDWEWLRNHNRHASVQQTQEYISGLTAFFLDETKSRILNYHRK